jgi:hypothetical protein
MKPKRIKKETQRSSVAEPRLEEEPKRTREKHKGHLSSVAVPDEETKEYQVETETHLSTVAAPHLDEETKENQERNTKVICHLLQRHF